MPPPPGTPLRNLRVDTDLWEAFGEALPDGVDRSEAIRAYMRWHLRQKGARLPERPAAAPVATTDTPGASAEP